MIEIADRIHELPVDKVLGCLTVACFQRAQQRAAVGLFHALVEPVRDRILVDRSNLQIRNFHRQIELVSVLALPGLFEITGEDQEVPQIVL